jgi:hypothetical protein
MRKGVAPAGIHNKMIWTRQDVSRLLSLLLISTELNVRMNRPGVGKVARANGGTTRLQQIGTVSKLGKRRSQIAPKLLDHE